MATVSRRQALSGAAAGLGVPVLAACGGDDGGTTAADPSGSSPESQSGAPAPADTTATRTPQEAAGEGLVATADVPVGGGVVLAQEELVVTQPSEGEFKVFTAICTHQGCLVGAVTAGEIVCPCHGSRFSISDGSVTNGPADEPLKEFEVSVSGDQLTIAS